ncbi:MAG: hypothetical protein Q9185_006035 [Variospora sp. 1 TL-2023]
MSHLTVDSINSAGAYNRLVMDHEATEPAPNRSNKSLSPLLLMASSNGRLEAYGYGLPALGSHTAPKPRISSEMWDSFASAFAAHVHAAGIADIVSLKSKQCINGGEFVAPDRRVLFRLPMEAIEVQPGSVLLESGWGFDAETEPDGDPPKTQDRHVTQVVVTKGGTKPVSHQVEPKGKRAFDPNEVPLPYTDAMWASAQSKGFWVVNKEVGVAAQHDRRKV